MATLNLKEEQDAIDYITNCTFSVDFLQAFSEEVFNYNSNQVSILDFYLNWLKHTNAPERKIPFSPGSFLGLLFVGILYAKENWFALIPNVGLSDANEWGVNRAKPNNPKDPNISLRNFSRRIRNSLGHGYAQIEVPQKGVTKENILDKVRFKFKDQNMMDPSDTFEVSLTMKELVYFIRKFQSEIYDSVKSKSS